MSSVEARGHEEKEKVLAYVTKGDRVLVFRHVAHPEVGYQVPGGSILPGEPFEEAALREAREETGLRGLRPIRHLGTYRHDMEPFAAQTHVRHVFHVVCDDATPETFRHFELHPSSGGGNPIEFEFEWLPLDGTDLGLVAGHGRLLPLLTPDRRSASPGRPSRLADVLRPKLDAYRRRRAESISRAFGALLGVDAPGLSWTGERALPYAALQHLFYLVKVACAERDSEAVGELLAAWRRADVESSLRARPFLVVPRGECQTVADGGFDSPLHLVPPTRIGTPGSADVDRFAEPLALLRDKGFGAWIDDFVGIVVTLARRGPSDPTESYTVSALPGTVFVDTPDEPVRMGELLLHEGAHTWLNDALGALGESLPRGARYYSPWKATERPAYGILHAIFAFSQMTRYFAAMADDPGVSAYGRTYCSERLRVEVATLREALPQAREVMSFVQDPGLRGVVLDELNRALQLGAPK